MCYYSDIITFKRTWSLTIPTHTRHPVVNHIPLDKQLSKEGHTTYLHDLSDFYEITEIKVNEEVVHHCKITDFQFGGDGELDPLCKLIVDKVNTAY
ncbi:unnamed protein product [Schistosoma mattheei]|uniref:Uncharacterized protein n=1 Tax=Schistosoma mattheei TaxID=31246 RepID=A0AA85ARC4_9TREM|nr:unnamed protein product [Schistosoma mattheei]